MKHVFKRLSPLVLFVFFTISTPAVGFSQGDVLGPKPPDDYVTSNAGRETTAQFGIDPGCDTLDPGCPIDGGLSALLVLGAGYGIRRVRKARKTVAHE